jgi:hypothetical protein
MSVVHYYKYSRRVRVVNSNRKLGLLKIGGCEVSYSHVNPFVNVIIRLSRITLKIVQT